METKETLTQKFEKKTGIKEEITRRIKEIKRREGVYLRMKQKEKLNNESKSEEDVNLGLEPTIPLTKEVLTDHMDIYKIGFKNPNHSWALVNIANLHQRPCCKRPAFRILGFFETQEKGIEFVQKNKDKYDDVGCYIVPTHGYMPICESVERQNSIQYVERHVKKLRDRFYQKRNIHKKEFKKRKEDGQEQSTSKVSEKENNTYATRRRKRNKQRLERVKKRALKTVQARKQLELREKYFNQNLKKVSKDLPREAEKKRQNFAVVCCIQDDKILVKEPLIMILGGFETREQGEFYATHIVSKYILELHAYVVDMYEWLYPEDIDQSNIKEVYRTKELDRVMKQQKANPTEVDEYREYLKTKNKILKPIDVEYNQELKEGEEPTPIPENAKLILKDEYGNKI